MTAPRHRRRLRVRPGGRRTSAAARMRAHLLALEAWMMCPSLVRSAAILSPREAVALRTRLVRLAAAAEGWAAASRRWA